jgi:hypothetical protein
MLRILNVLSVLALIGSAVYAYSIKYATLYQAERMAKLTRELHSDTDEVAMLRAEWAHVAAPVRIQALADRYLGGQVMQLSQIASLSDLPDRPDRGDAIGQELLRLGLAKPIDTAKAGKSSSATPAASQPKR